MDEQFEFLRLVVARLEAARIPYMLTGSLALAIYALPRMTRDIDLVIDGDERRVAALIGAFAPDSYRRRTCAPCWNRRRDLNGRILPNGGRVSS